jgi:hypothetical protein
LTGWGNGSVESVGPNGKIAGAGRTSIPNWNGYRTNPLNMSRSAIANTGLLSKKKGGKSAKKVFGNGSFKRKMPSIESERIALLNFTIYFFNEKMGSCFFEADETTNANCVSTSDATQHITASINRNL